MIRSLPCAAAALLLLALTACAHPEAKGCDVSVERDIVFSTETDQLRARALGEACDKAVALYVVSSPEGHPLWAWTAPMGHAFGAQFDMADEEAIAGFLADWAHPALASTAAAPDWSDALPTHFDRQTYEDVRARDLPMLCHLSGVARETCIYWEPAAAGATALYERAAAPAENLQE